MKNIELKLGDCNKILKKVKAKSIDMIFADPPYNLSGKTHLTVKSGRPVPGNKGDWDMIDDYEKFTAEWLGECMEGLCPDHADWAYQCCPERHTSGGRAPI